MFYGSSSNSVCNFFIVSTKNFDCCEKALLFVFIPFLSHLTFSKLLIFTWKVTSLLLCFIGSVLNFVQSQRLILSLLISFPLMYSLLKAKFTSSWFYFIRIIHLFSDNIRLIFAFRRHKSFLQFFEFINVIIRVW